jgi:Metallo-beta-lactamase superfamily
VPTASAELTQLTASLFVWQTYDRAVKADLFSTALVSGACVFIVDPIRLERVQLDHLRGHGRIAAVIVTNANHHRAASWYSEQFSAPVAARAETFAESKPERFMEIGDGGRIQEELEAIAIDGAPAGELALYHPGNGGTLIVGDALINFEPYGFSFLPRKYCRDEKQMRRSLRKLCDRKVERILFAHGLPILADAGTRLRQLLEASDA